MTTVRRTWAQGALGNVALETIAAASPSASKLFATTALGGTNPSYPHSPVLAMDSPARTSPSLSVPSLPGLRGPAYGVDTSLRIKDLRTQSMRPSIVSRRSALAHRLHREAINSQRESIALPPFQMPAAPQEASGKRVADIARPQLSVVMPVYNEGAVIAEVVTAWIQELERLGIDYEFRAYDDGSADETGRILERLAAEQHGMVVTRKANSGHGP